MLRTFEAFVITLPHVFFVVARLSWHTLLLRSQLSIEDGNGSVEPVRSGPHRRRLHRHFSRARHQIELELDQFRRAVGVSLGAYAGEATGGGPVAGGGAFAFGAGKADSRSGGLA